MARYYSILIWGNLTKNQKYLQQLCKNEQLLNVLVYVLREEREISLARAAVRIIYDMCAKKEVNPK